VSVAVPPPRFTDPAVFGRVAVLLGGTSSEREVSLESGHGVLEALRARGVDAQPVDGIPALLEALQAGRFDRVFNILHGQRGGGEDGVVQGLMETLGVPYTGSGVLGSALAMDKIRSKQVWLGLGLPTARYLRLARGEDVHAAARRFGLPVVVKPSQEGSSVGVSRVLDDAGLDRAVALAARYPGELLMEQLLQGEELTVAILAAGDGYVALPPIRIVSRGEWYDYHAKYVADDTQYLDAALSADEDAAVRALSLQAFHAVGCRGWGRVDLMRDRPGGQVMLIEVNTAPGMTSHSLVPKAAALAGMDYQELCWRVLETTLAAGVAS